jgi:hypothetical protein
MKTGNATAAHDVNMHQMRFTVLLALSAAGLITAQEQKHFITAPLNGGRQVRMTADEIERMGQYPSPVHLKGRVEIQTPACLPVGKNKKLVCDGVMILRADKATYYEDSGQIEAQGSVTVVPLYHEPAKTVRRAGTGGEAN